MLLSHVAACCAVKEAVWLCFEQQPEPRALARLVFACLLWSVVV